MRAAQIFGAAVAAVLAWAAPVNAAPVPVAFWYPAASGDSLARLIGNLVADFNTGHPDVKVSVVDTGSYDATWQRLRTAKSAGTLPDLAVTEISQLPALAASGIAQPIDKLVGATGGELLLKKFWPSMVLNCRWQGKIWALPFQRATPVMYFNKDAFAAAGLDPAKPPETWDDLAAAAKKLTQRAGGGAARWGVELPLDPSDWLYDALVYGNGGEVLSADATKVLWDEPNAIAALQYWWDLVNKDGSAPADTAWQAGPQEFAAGKTAILWHSTDALGFMRQQADFGWGLGRIPQQTRFAPPYRGGDLTLYATDPARQKAAWQFMIWLAAAPQAARWSAGSGFLATNVVSWQLPDMLSILRAFPYMAVTRQQLYDAKPAPAAPNYAAARAILNGAIGQVLANKAPLDAAMHKATAEADAALAK